MAQSNAKKKLIRLIQKYLAGKASPKEEQFLEAYYDSFDKEGEEPVSLETREQESMSRDMKAAIWERIGHAEQPSHTPIIKRTWFRMAVAAALVVGAFVPVYYFIVHTPAKNTIVQGSHQTAKPVHDALPGGNKATLTLADGTVIDLDKATNGTIATQGKTTVSKRMDGQLEYKGINSPLTIDHSPTYNTLSTPHGGQYFLVLPDGSKVWLNAASSIRYPTAFTGNERLVELTGEAYFEISKNPNMPFRVHFTSPSPGGGDREGSVEVMGTHFNVNAYPDEETIRTTLLEGKVKVTNQSVPPGGSNLQSAVIQPGQQAVFTRNARLTIHDVDTEEAVAWKNGLFYFDNVDIQAIMRQLARWYKVQVVFKGKIPARRFAGQVSRNANLSQVLKILELSKVHFTVENDIVTVLP